MLHLPTMSRSGRAGCSACRVANTSASLRAISCASTLSAGQSSLQRGYALEVAGEHAARSQPANGPDTTCQARPGHRPRHAMPAVPEVLLRVEQRDGAQGVHGNTLQAEVDGVLHRRGSSGHPHPQPLQASSERGLIKHLSA